MPQSKDPGRYPPQVHALVAQIAEGAPFKVRFDNPADAIACRFSMYGFRSALLGRIGTTKPHALKTLAEFDEIYPGFRFCKLTIRDACLEVLPYVGSMDALDVLAELSARIEVQPIAGAVPVSIERKDDGELER